MVLEVVTKNWNEMEWSGIFSPLFSGFYALKPYRILPLDFKKLNFLKHQPQIEIFMEGSRK